MKECWTCVKEIENAEYICEYCDRLFCSKECLIHNVAIIIDKCDYCGKPFNGKVVYDSHGIYGYCSCSLEDEHINGFYCSEDCLANAWKNHEMNGEKVRKL